MDMAIFIAVVTNDGKSGYSASFPDFPTCAVAARTVDEVIVRARHALLAHVEGLPAAGQEIVVPTAARLRGTAHYVLPPSMCRTTSGQFASSLMFQPCRWRESRPWPGSSV
jgi:predicted RNase H-like HicB family nuclease